MNTKRETLQKIALAILGGTALAAIPVGVYARDKSITRYVKTISLQQEVLVAHKLGDPTDSPEVKEFIGDNVCSRMNVLIEFMLKNFAKGKDTKSEEAYAECSRLFRTNKADLETMSVEGLKQWLDVMVPVVVLRRLLAHERVYFNSKKVPAWNQFSDLYRDTILAA